MGRGDLLERPLVVHHDRTLERQRRRELACLHAQIGAQGAERRGGDAGTRVQRGAVLLPVAATTVAVSVQLTVATSAAIRRKTSTA